MQNERILGYQVAQKLDEADLQGMVGGHSVRCGYFYTTSPGNMDYDCEMDQ